VSRYRHTACVSTPRRRCRRRSAEPESNGTARSDLVVSHHLAGLLHAVGLGFVAPQNRTGFAAFPGEHPDDGSAEADDRWSCRVDDCPSITVSRNAFHTPRRIPLASSRTASPRPLPSCRFQRRIGQPDSEETGSDRADAPEDPTRASEIPLSKQRASFTPEVP